MSTREATAYHEAGARTITIPNFLVEILARHLQTAPKSEWVFCAPGGGHLRYDNFRRRVWAPAVAKVGLEPLTFHELRHTAAALIDQRADILQISRSTFAGGRYWDRTSDLFGVNEALSR